MNSLPWTKSYPDGLQWDATFKHVGKTIPMLFDEAVAQWPDRPAYDFLGKKATYAQLADYIDRATKGFQDLGVGPGVHVGLYLPNCPHYLIAFFAILKAGGTVVNYSPLDAERELEHKIADSRTDMIVTLDLMALYPRIAEMLSKTRLRKLIIGNLPEALPFPKSILYPLAKRKDIAKIPKDNKHVPFSALLAPDEPPAEVPISDPAEQVAVLQYTGGTTGLPKAAMLTHGNLVAATEQAGNWSESLLDKGTESILAVLPLFHVYALTGIMLVGLSGGSEIILHPRFDIDMVLKDMDRKKPTIFPGVPTMYTAINNHPDLGKFDLSSLKVCISGGAPLPAEVQKTFQDLTGCKLVEGYGLTESSPTGATNPLDGRSRIGSVGLPLQNTTFTIVDVDDPSKVLDGGEVGEICISGPQIMKGYWNRPEETANALKGGRLHTGDIGYIDGDGFVHIVDRKKDMILSGGFNVYPRTIEDAIYEHDAVAEVIVIGIPDDYRGEAAKAFVKLREGASEFSLDELLAFLKDKLGKHELPAELEFRAELPKTLVGKLSRKDLAEEERAKREQSDGTSAAA